MKMVQRCCARVSRVSSQSRCRAQFLAATWPTDTAESFSSRARLLAAYPRTGYSSNRSPSRCRPASRPRELQARPLAVASAPTRPLAAYPRWNLTLSPPSSKLAAPTRRLTAALSTHSPCHCLLFLDNPQSTRVHPVASTCTHRPSAPLAFERFSRTSASTRVPLPSLSCASSSPFHLSKRQTHKP